VKNTNQNKVLKPSNLIRLFSKKSKQQTRYYAYKIQSDLESWAQELPVKAKQGGFLKGEFINWSRHPCGIHI
jgi:hypothetical protein